MQEKNRAICGRPSWDEYFLSLAFIVSIRSDDQFIKHGAILVDDYTKHIIGCGYNGTIKGFNDDELLMDREARRPFMIHSEENCILNCTNHPSQLKCGSTIYVTGKPCIVCLQRIINFGISRIVYADGRTATITESEETQKIREKILSMHNIKIETIPLENKWIKKAVNFQAAS